MYVGIFPHNALRQMCSAQQRTFLPTHPCITDLERDVKRRRLKLDPCLEQEHRALPNKKICIAAEQSMRDDDVGLYQPDGMAGSIWYPS
jgi:hypothetical protein